MAAGCLFRKSNLQAINASPFFYCRLNPVVTANICPSAFGTWRRRLNVVPSFISESAAGSIMKVSVGLLLDAFKLTSLLHWRMLGIRITLSVAVGKPILRRTT